MTKQHHASTLVRYEPTAADALDDARWLLLSAMERVNRMRSEREFARRLERSELYGLR